MNDTKMSSNGSPNNTETYKLIDGSTQRASAQHGIITQGHGIIANLDHSSSSRSNGSNKTGQTQKVYSSGSSGCSAKSNTKMPVNSFKNIDIIGSVYKKSNDNIRDLNAFK
jgi:hypothetical protein